MKQLLLLVSLILPALTSAEVVYAQNNGYSAEVQRIFSAMSVEEKVGQVFLVSFQGSTVHDESRIISLIEKKHIGGVVGCGDNHNAGVSKTFHNGR